MDLKRVKIEGLQIFKIDKDVNQKVNVHTPEPIASETQKAHKKIKKGEGNLFFIVSFVYLNGLSLN